MASSRHLRYRIFKNSSCFAPLRPLNSIFLPNLLELYRTKMICLLLYFRFLDCSHNNAYLFSLPFKALDDLIASHLPKLAAHFASEGVVAPMYAKAWFMTVFTRDFPLGISARVLDCLLGDPDGTKILHSVALALLQRAQADLLEADLSDCLILLRELPKTHCDNPRALMEDAFKFNIKH